MVTALIECEQTLADFIRHLRLERGLSERTVTTYGNRLKDYLRTLEAKGVRAELARRADVVAHLTGLKERGLEATSILCSAAAIRSFYRYLIDLGVAALDPTIGLKLPKPSTRLQEPLTKQEIVRLLAAPSSRRFSGVRDRAIMELLYCGLRLGEALGLDIGQVHLDEGYVKVRGKGDKERIVPMGRMAVEALKRYLKAKKAKFGAESTPLFVSQLRSRLSHCGFWRRFKLYARRARIASSAHPHTMRHSFCLQMLSGGADLRSIQLLCGHSSLATTQKYLNLDLAALKNVCEAAHPRF